MGEALTLTTTWTNSKNTMLSERSRHRGTQRVWFHPWETSRTGRSTDTESGFTFNFEILTFISFLLWNNFRLVEERKDSPRSGCVPFTTSSWIFLWNFSLWENTYPVKFTILSILGSRPGWGPKLLPDSFQGHREIQEGGVLGSLQGAAPLVGPRRPLGKRKKYTWIVGVGCH